jgi:hypothetical protein
MGNSLQVKLGKEGPSSAKKLDFHKCPRIFFTPGYPFTTSPPYRAKHPPYALSFLERLQFMSS